MSLFDRIKGEYPSTKNSKPSEKDFSYNEFEIKKKNGKTRKIVNPSPALKRWQRRQNKRLLSIFKKSKFQGIFHGFVPKRNAVTAATVHIPYDTTMMFDITNFFDNVTFNLINSVTDDVKKLHNHERFYHKDGYCAQGFPTSPMLCNIALLPFVEELTAYLEEKCGTQFALTGYADDIQVSFNWTSYEAEKELESKIDTILNTLGLSLNKAKTRTKYEKFGARRILGVNVTKNGILPTRKVNRKVRALRHKMKYSTEKQYVLAGMASWQSCSLPNGVTPFSL